jgi:SAM-dependent methyltransferase
MTHKAELDEFLAEWDLPKGTNLLDRIEEMIRPVLFAGHFGRSFTRFVSGSQYHLGGAQDTRELVDLAALSSSDHVLDVCCFVGGPAVQLAHTVGCRVTGIDLDANVIAAASRIAQVAGLADLLEFRVADAADLPFPDSTFTVIWNQCSLDSNEHWLKEFDRVLSLGGRFAFTFQRKGKNDNRWTLADLTSLLADLGYTVSHADDITERDIEIGWKALDAKLSENAGVFRAALGDAWIQKAHQEFHAEIGRMKAGEYGNARIVARKPGRPQALRSRSL